MKNRIVRLVLVLLALAAVGGAGYYVFTLEQRGEALKDAERVFTEDAIRLHATLAELRAAQAGYVASGQDTAVWIQKVAQLRQQADTQLRRLAAPGTGQEADLATVAEGLASFGRFDTRVQEVLRDEQLLTASNLIFTDASQVLTAAGNALGSARGVRAAKAGATIAQARQQELYAAGGAAGLVLLVLLLLLPVARIEREAERSEERQADDASQAVDTALPAASGRGGLGLDFDFERSRNSVPDLDLSEDPREKAEGFDSLRPAPHVPVVSRADSVPEAESQADDAAAPNVDLTEAARLCTDLARVHDTSELQGLLGRAASLLDATGIVVWMGGAEGDVLWPAFSYGYTPQALSRMQALPRDGSTPVSVAFRKGLIEVVPAGDRTRKAGTETTPAATGAIVAPILTATGCVGVMAVEVPHGGESSEASQAMASIIAAQLATLVAGETAPE